MIKKSLLSYFTSVAVATNQKVDKDNDTATIADSALGTASISGATFTGTQFSEVSCSIHTSTEYRCEHVNTV